MRQILKPSKLEIGDTIGIVASSLPVLPSFRENYERGKKVIADLGFKIKEGKTIGKTRWWAAGTPEEVAQDINSMFGDKNIRAIIAQDGGYSAISVIEYLDYDLISKNPKPFMGLSDMTIYHLAILAKTGMVGFHMDYLSSFTGQFFLRFLTGSNPPGKIEPLSDWEEWKKGEAKGHLVGGLLERISLLAGTKYFPPLEYFDGAILFWEHIGGDLSDIYQYLFKLKNMGILERINGMMIGKIKYLKKMSEEIVEPSVREIVLEILKDYKFPIMANMDFGHFTVNIPMPIGIKVSFDTSKKELNFLEGAVI
ncbi:MAG: Peptidase U61 LD-carboxypeptidase A [Microgenomates group bacterium Gr01-1014_7]|nr:MAG: Peptidase U61 LD-carboxypeptidase A [Microgenomates group bacterium Gr01-1014_7]